MQKNHFVPLFGVKSEKGPKEVHALPGDKVGLT